MGLYGPYAKILWKSPSSEDDREKKREKRRSCGTNFGVLTKPDVSHPFHVNTRFGGGGEANRLKKYSQHIDRKMVLAIACNARRTRATNVTDVRCARVPSLF
tara:strand:+ start:693 stop:998 length:306 start_codon:yes stop_codon:yes gene_type:complete